MFFYIFFLKIKEKHFLKRKKTRKGICLRLLEIFEQPAGGWAVTSRRWETRGKGRRLRCGAGAIGHNAAEGGLESLPEAHRCSHQRRCQRRFFF